MQNRHPADELADVRSEIRHLEDREEQLRSYLLEHPHDRKGVDYEALIGTQQRKRVDLKALADEIGASLLQRFTRYATITMVKLREREGVEG